MAYLTFYRSVQSMSKHSSLLLRTQSRSFAQLRRIFKGCDAYSTSNAWTKYFNFLKFNRRKLLALFVGVGTSSVLLIPTYSTSNVVSCEPTADATSDDGSEPEFLAEDRSDARNTGLTLEYVKQQSLDLLNRTKDEVGAPGVVIAVSVDGEEIWNAGIGYADVENRVPCGKDTVMRIASISKPITVAMVAKLWENNKLDIDAPINKYIKDWPDKFYADKKATITTRQLLSHLGGIRHYERDCGKKKDGKEKDKGGEKQDKTDADAKKKKKASNKSEFDLKEYHIKTKYDSVKSALSIFKDDDLCSLPGTEYLYSTHGYTLVSAVLEGAAGKKFADMTKALFRELGMEQTYLEENEPIIYNRARYYVKDKNGRLKNAPYVDNSYKWAGGGIISTASDLVQFADVMLYSYQRETYDNNSLPGYLKSNTMKELWSPVIKTKCTWDADGGFYGLGWGIMPEIAKYGKAKKREFYVSHTGGAIGASSVLLVLPKSSQEINQSEKPLPQGITVAIITNMQGVNLNGVCLKIAKLFQQVEL